MVFQKDYNVYWSRQSANMKWHFWTKIFLSYSTKAVSHKNTLKFYSLENCSKIVQIKGKVNCRQELITFANYPPTAFFQLSNLFFFFFVFTSMGKPCTRFINRYWEETGTCNILVSVWDGKPTCMVNTVKNQIFLLLLLLLFFFFNFHNLVLLKKLICRELFCKLKDRNLWGLKSVLRTNFMHENDYFFYSFLHT